MIKRMLATMLERHYLAHICTAVALFKFLESNLPVGASSLSIGASCCPSAGIRNIAWKRIIGFQHTDGSC